MIIKTQKLISSLAIQNEEVQYATTRIEKIYVEFTVYGKPDRMNKKT